MTGQLGGGGAASPGNGHDIHLNSWGHQSWWQQALPASSKCLHLGCTAPLAAPTSAPAAAAAANSSRQQQPARQTGARPRSMTQYSLLGHGLQAGAQPVEGPLTITSGSVPLIPSPQLTGYKSPLPPGLLIPQDAWLPHLSTYLRGPQAGTDWSDSDCQLLAFWSGNDCRLCVLIRQWLPAWHSDQAMTASLEFWSGNDCMPTVGSCWGSD